MNKFYLIAVFVLSFNFSFSAPVIKSVTAGYWNQATSWDLNRLPQAGDSVVITAGNTITVSNDEYLNGASFLKIYGKLTFENNNSTLNFGNNSFIWVFSGGQITGGGSASQKLRLNGNIIFDGASSTIYGPQMVSVSSNGFTPMITGPSTPLPVKFVGFTLTKKNNDALIQWSTSEEINANIFEVERSIDGNNWNTIAYVAAIGNSSALHNYSFTDKNISTKIAYYRIKEVDVDGKATLTTIKFIRTDITSPDIDINIASVNHKVLLQFPAQVSGNIVIRFVSLEGQVLDQQMINNPAGQVVLNSKLTGNYIISLSDGQKINAAKQVIL
jgi:hypothetical protein